MNYVKVEPHPVTSLLNEDEKADAFKSLGLVGPARLTAKLSPFCGTCRLPVGINKLNKFKHLQIEPARDVA